MMSVSSRVLEFSKVDFSYPGSAPVLKDFSAALHRSEIICIIGSSGCGKTTLLNLAGGFLLPDAGLISDSNGPVVEPLRSRIMVFQDLAQLFPWLNVRKNAAFPDGDTELVFNLLKLVGLSDSAELYPLQLSGGMKQRAVIARALAAEPELLLLDEPFTALDAPTRRGLQDMLLKLNTELDVSMLFVTHDIREAVYLADRILVMTANGVGELDISSTAGFERGKRRNEFSDDFVAIERSVYAAITGY